MGSSVTANNTSIKSTILLLLFCGTACVYCEKYMEDINALFGYVRSFVMLQQILRIITTGLKRLL